MLKVAVIVALLAGFLIASTMQFKDESDSSDYYCQMVNYGLWPNYKELDCEGENE